MYFPFQLYEYIYIHIIEMENTYMFNPIRK